MPAKKKAEAIENTEKKELSIEEAFARLEEIIQTLESPETGLQDSMKLYTEGVELLNNCQNTLEGVEQQLKILQPETDGLNDE